MENIYNFMKRHPIGAVFIAFLPYIITFIVYFVNFVISNGFAVSSSMEHWGQTGDFFGGILNPIYSFFALFLLLSTFLINREQLEDNKKQSEIEKFENNFFNMLDMLKSLLKDLRDEPKHNTLDSILSNFIELGNKLFFEQENVNMLATEFTSDCRLTLGLKETPLLDNLFRLLKQILKYIYYKYPNENENSNINERKNYSDIVRSFLPEKLFWLLAIHAAINKKDPYNKNLEEYHKLILKFAFLEDMKCEDPGLFDKIKLYYEILLNYDMEAFGDLKNVKYTMNLLADNKDLEWLLGIEKFKKLEARINKSISRESPSVQKPV